MPHHSCDLWQVSYVRGDQEWLAWLVDWKDVLLRPSKLAGGYQLYRKTDMQFMIGCDVDQWDALCRVREATLANQRLVTTSVRSKTPLHAAGSA